MITIDTSKQDVSLQDVIRVFQLGTFAFEYNFDATWLDYVAKWVSEKSAANPPQNYDGIKIVFVAGTFESSHSGSKLQIAYIPHPTANDNSRFYKEGNASWQKLVNDYFYRPE